jgi:hypothetical protein
VNSGEYADVSEVFTVLYFVLYFHERFVLQQTSTLLGLLIMPANSPACVDQSRIKERIRYAIACLPI